MNLSFTSAKQLRSRIAILPPVPEWKARNWETPFPTKQPLMLLYRNPVECLQHLLQNPLLQDHIEYTPFRLYESATKTMRVYSEWLSGDFAWEVQASQGYICSYNNNVLL